MRGIRANCYIHARWDGGEGGRFEGRREGGKEGRKEGNYREEERPTEESKTEGGTRGDRIRKVSRARSPPPL